MISPKAIEKGKKWAETHPVGTGPFKFKSFERDVHLKYERFDGYWQKGLPYLDGVEWDWIKDPMVSLAAFKSGQANVLLNSSGKNMYALEKEGYNVVVGPAVILGLAGDNKNPDSIFRDKRIHMAMDYAINKKKITSKLGYGYYEPLNQIAPRRSYAHVSDLKGREYNPGRAKQLLTEAGYPDGFSTTMGVLGGGARDIWLAVQADLAEVGIKVRIQWLTRPAFMAWRFKGKHPKNSLIEVVGQYTAEFLWTINNSWGLGSADIRDVARPPGWGEAIKQALDAKDFATKKARTQVLTNIAHEEAFFVPITAGPRSYVMSTNIVDADIYNPDPNHWHVEKAWIKK
jgi:peptide/nickel transport system substrate-binding protein